MYMHKHSPMQLVHHEDHIPSDRGLTIEVTARMPLYIARAIKAMEVAAVTATSAVVVPIITGNCDTEAPVI